MKRFFSILIILLILQINIFALPTDYRGLTMWVSGDDPVLTNLTLGDGQPIGGIVPWTNRIDSKRWENPTSSTQPAYRLEGSPPNGLPYISFGNNDFLVWNGTASTIICPNAYAIFMVLRPQRAASPNCDWSGAVPFNFNGSNGYGDINLCLSGGSNKFHLHHYIGGGSSVDINSTTNYSVGTWYVLEAWYDGAFIHMRINGDTEVSALAISLATTANTPLLGLFADVTGPMTDIAEAIVYREVPSAPQRAILRSELGTKYAISVTTP